MRYSLGEFATMLALGARGAVLAASLHGAAHVDTVARLDRFIRAEMGRQRIPGVAVGIVSRGKPILSRGYGYANVEHQAPVKPETVFLVGSLTKQFTAAEVMLLVQEGRLRLDDPITKHLAGAPKQWKSITIRHLLNHTSGVHEIWLEEGPDLRRDFSEDEIARRAFDHPLDFPPGSRWSYCNTGYELLGIVVRKVSGRSWGDFLRQRVFTPLDMTTARVISEEEIVPNRAAGYRLVDGELRNQEWVAPSLNTLADGGLYLSVLDVIAWDRGLRSKAILSAESWSKVFEPARLNSGRSYPYGFGWQLATFAGQTVRWHGGEWQGFKSYIARFLEDDLTIIVLTNLAEGAPSRFVQGIVPILDPKLVPEDPAPIPDREPAVASRLKEILSVPSTRPGDVLELPYISFPFYPTGWKEYKEAASLLRRLGIPDRLELIARRELGDDVLYTYIVRYPDATLWAAIGIAPDGRISHCAIRIQA